MANLEFKKNKDKFEVNLYHRKGSRSHYRNFITKDPNQLARVLMDLHFEGCKVEEAIKIFLRKLNNRDWLGL